MKNLIWGFLLLLSAQLCAKTNATIDKGQIIVKTDKSALSALAACNSSEFLNPFVYTLYKKSDHPDECALWKEVKEISSPSNTFRFKLPLSEGKYFVSTQYLKLKTCIDQTKQIGEYHTESSEILIIEHESKKVNQSAESSSYVIYPNPVKDVLQIKSLEYLGAVEIEVYSQSMELQFRQRNQFTQEEIAIDLGQQENGIYFLKLITSDKTETIKFIKQ